MTFFVYIVTDENRNVLYIGVTNDLCRRVEAHRLRRSAGFSSRFRTSTLVFVEEWRDVNLAIAREKQLKGWRRAKKVSLINSVNPDWLDLLPQDGS